jgi:hypothetical protein
VGAVFNRDFLGNRGRRPLPPTINFYLTDLEFYVVSYKRFRGSEFNGSGFSTAAYLKAASLIGKETDERRTSNIERPTSNTVFCHFIKRLSKPTSANRLRRARSDIPFEIFGSLVLK